MNVGKDAWFAKVKTDPARYAALREKQREADKRWREKDPERTRAADRKKNASRSKEARAAWREANREKIRAQDAAVQRKRRAAKAIAEGREPGRIGAVAKYTDDERVALRRHRSLDYWKRNPEKRKELGDRYYEANKEAIIERTRRNQERVKRDDPELYRQWRRSSDRNRRARKAGNGGTHTKDDIDALFEKQKGRCALCLGRLGKSFHVDHFVPLAKGGTNDRSNLRLLHKKCNLEKGSRDPYEHAVRNGMLCF